MIQIKNMISLFDGDEFLGYIDGQQFQNIGDRFFEILNSKEFSANFKYLKMASLFHLIDEDIASLCFNKVDKNKLSILEKWNYDAVFNKLTQLQLES